VEETEGGGVSVVIPVHNGALFVGEALDSVFAQTYRPLDVIVVDDGSDDDTTAVVERYGPRARLIRQTRAGPAEARNTGVAAATGAYLAFLDADDLWPPGKLAAQVAVLEEHPDIDLVFGLAVQFDGETSARAIQRDPPSAAALPALVAGGMVTRLDTFRGVGPLSTEWRVGEFIDWFARAQEMGLTSHVIQQVVLFRRLHAANLGRQDGGSRVEFTRVLRATLERRRREGLA